MLKVKEITSISNETENKVSYHEEPHFMLHLGLPLHMNVQLVSCDLRPESGPLAGKLLFFLTDATTNSYTGACVF